MGHVTTKMLRAIDKTSASFSSDPPYDFSTLQKGSIVLRANNWGNVDNTLICDVYWGVRAQGLLPNTANLTWFKDPDASATITLAGTGGVAVPVAGVIPLALMKSKYMKLVFTLAGTTKEVDVEAWCEGIT